MFQKTNLDGSIDPAFSFAAQQRKTPPGGDRQPLGTSDAVGEPDRVRPCTLSPDSRQNREARKPTSSHLQGRARVMNEPNEKEVSSPVASAPQTFVGIDVSK